MNKLKEKKISLKQGILLLVILYILFAIILIAVSKNKTNQDADESGKTVMATESITIEVPTTEERSGSNSETTASTMSEKEYEKYIEKLKEELVTASPNESDEGQ